MSNSRQRLARITRARLGRAFRARLLAVLLGCAAAGTLEGCRRSQVTENPDGAANAANVTSATPPFVTREPERYQAVRVITFTEPSSNQTNSSPTERTSRVMVARDGEKRREEYFDEASEQIVYLEIPAGRFILLPASNLYADLDTVPTETAKSSRPDESTGFAPDQLLNEAQASATYEKLGAEMLAGRMTAKYRVTAARRTDANTGNTETIIWIDEALGMPVRSETVSHMGDHSSKVIMELNDIKLEAEERLFVLPASFRKVETRLILARVKR